MSLKAVEHLIDKYGVSAFSDDTPLLKRKKVKALNACDKGMPFCFYQAIKELPEDDFAWCFTAYLPDKSQRLAMYLVDNTNQVVEQVYFPRDRKGILACQKIQKCLARSLCSANSADYTLAA